MIFKCSFYALKAITSGKYVFFDFGVNYPFKSLVSLKLGLLSLVQPTHVCHIIPLPPLLFLPSVPSSPQFSLLSEVRGLVTPQDLEHFDGLVLRREIQALKARQGTAGAMALQQDSLSMVSYPDTLTSSSASFMTNTTLSSARVGRGFSSSDTIWLFSIKRI